MTKDAIRGVKHFRQELLVHEVEVKSLEKWSTPVSPRSLYAAVSNADPDHDYIVRIYEKVDTVALPRRAKK